MHDVYTPPKSDLTLKSREVVYVGFWRRALASLLDTIWVILLILPLGWMVYGSSYFNSTEFVQGYSDVFISYILPFLVTIMFWRYKAATPGKMILGMQIVDAETFEKVPNGRLVIRYLGYYLSIVFLFLGFIWVAWDNRKQGWHDKLAKTVVIRTG